MASSTEQALPVSGNATASGEQKFSRLTLTAMVVGSMVGAGIFSLPGRFGAATGPFGAIIAWIIAGGGMLMLAFVFQFLAQRKPDLDSGIFARIYPVSKPHKRQVIVRGRPRGAALGRSGPAGLPPFPGRSLPCLAMPAPPFREA